MVSEHLDLAVLEFLEEERAAGRVVRNKDLRTRALEIAGMPSFFSDCFEQIACMLVRVCVCVCVCVCEREREREREKEWGGREKDGPCACRWTASLWVRDGPTA